MKKGWLVLAALLAVGGASNASALLIDSFNTGSSTSGGSGLLANILQSSNNATDTGAGILGGEREVTALYYNPPSTTGGQQRVQVDLFDSNLLQHGQDSGVAGASIYVYDGTPGGDTNVASGTDATPIADRADVNGGGLPATDLTADGSTLFAFEGVTSDHAGWNLGVRVYSGAGNYSDLLLTNLGVLNNATLNFDFSAFAIAGGTGADFSNIGAIAFWIDGSNTLDLDVSINNLETTTVPEPATLMLMGLGMTTMGAIRRRRRSAKVA